MNDLIQTLKRYTRSGTAAERRMAQYFNNHLQDLNFETAASIADRLGLSPMTVGRFLRALGYQGPDDMKAHLREAVAPATWQIPPSIEQLQRGVNEGQPLAGLIAEQIEMLHHVYNLASQPQWADAVAMFLSSREIFVAAHHGLSGLGGHFCERLTAARDDVHFCSGDNGSYIELLGRQTTDALLIIIDSHRFAKSRLLARNARRSGYRLLLVTGQYTEWAHEFANATLALPPQRVGARDNLAAMTALMEAFATAAAQAVGEEAELRGRRVAELEGMFAETPAR